MKISTHDLPFFFLLNCVFVEKRNYFIFIFQSKISFLIFWDYLKNDIKKKPDCTLLLLFLLFGKGTSSATH